MEHMLAHQLINFLPYLRVNKANRARMLIRWNLKQLLLSQVLWPHPDPSFLQMISISFPGSEELLDVPYVANESFSHIIVAIQFREHFIY